MCVSASVRCVTWAGLTPCHTVLMSDPTPTPPRKPRASTVRGARATYRDAALKQGRGFTPDKQAEYLSHLAGNIRPSKAAELVNVNYQTVREYRKKDPAFVAAEAEAEAQGTEAVEDALYNLAVGGHMTAIMFVLQNRQPDRWKDMRQIAKTVKHEGTVTHELDAGPAMQRIMHLEATLRERAALRSGEPLVIDVPALEPGES